MKIWRGVLIRNVFDLGRQSVREDLKNFPAWPGCGYCE